MSASRGGSRPRLRRASESRDGKSVEWMEKVTDEQYRQ
jgi:hypothetical protein